MNFQLALNNVLSNPGFKPPENLFKLNLRGNFEDLLGSCSTEVCIEFIVSEAWLVLPIWEAKHPDDSRPRDAIVAAENYKIIGADAAYAYTANDAADNAAWAVTAAATAAWAAYTANDAADDAAWAAYTANDAADDAAWAAWAAATAAAAASTATKTPASKTPAWASHYGAKAAQRANPNITLMNQLGRLLSLNGSVV